MQGSEGVTAPFVCPDFALQISTKQTLKSTLIFNSFISILGCIFPPSNHKDKRTKKKTGKRTFLVFVFTRKRT